jgi:hypothetical protein
MARIYYLDEKLQRYALVVAKSGQILSTTTDKRRAPRFDDKTQDATCVWYGNRPQSHIKPLFCDSKKRAAA